TSRVDRRARVQRASRRVGRARGRGAARRPRGARDTEERVMASARAKVILFGEHAVVHGRLAVVAALDGGARAKAESIQGGRASTLSLRPWGRGATSEDDDDLGRAFHALLD